MLKSMNKNIAMYKVSEIIDGLYRMVYLNSRYAIHYFYFKGFEIDFFEVTSSDYCNEFEIKTNLKDLKNDFHKTQKHNFFLEGKLCNRFFYVVPKEISEESLFIIPTPYGILTYDGYGIDLLRKAKLIHKTKIDHNTELDILNKSYYRYKRMLLNIETPRQWQDLKETR